jgi:hypothetical protein
VEKITVLYTVILETEITQKSGYVTGCEITILFRTGTLHCHLAVSDIYAASYLMHIVGFHPQIKKDRGLKFTTHIPLQPRLKISGVIPPLAYLICLYVFVFKQAAEITYSNANETIVSLILLCEICIST